MYRVTRIHPETASASMGQSIQNIAVIGAGALGAIYGSLMHQTDPGSVCFIAGDGRRDGLQREGVVVNGERFLIPVQSPEEPSPADLVIVAVKHYQLDQAVEDMRRAVGPGTAILSVMNGIDSEERIGAVFGMEKVLYGLALGIDAVRVDNAISYSNLGRILFGEKINAVLSDRVRRIGMLFDRAGIVHVTPPDMIRGLWFKYMINVGVNQVSAVLGADYGTLRSSARARDLMGAAMREVISLAKAVQVDLSEQDIGEWYRILDCLDPAGKTSMLQDVEARRATEVEMLAGTVIELGRRHGILTPVNRMLYEALKRIGGDEGRVQRT
jgi:2-dehydropantoate 2-reductase